MVDVAFRLVVVIGVAVGVWHSALMHGRVMALMVGDRDRLARYLAWLDQRFEAAGKWRVWTGIVGGLILAFLTIAICPQSACR